MRPPRFFVALLDRSAVGSHLARLADSEAPVITRMTAARQASDTFFYRANARQRLEGIAADEDEPEALRREARTALRWLGDKGPH